MKRQTTLFLILLASALLIRILVMFWALQFRENTDVLRYRDWGKIAYLHSLNDTYKPDYLSFGTLPNNQPPGSTYIISSAYQVNIVISKLYLKFAGNTIDSQQFAGTYIQNAVLRFPQIIADILLGCLIYLLVKNYKQKFSLLATSLFLFNPIIIFNSAFWGQMDSLNNLFLFMSLFFLIKKRYTLAVLSFFLCLYIKVSLIYLLPLFLLTLYKYSSNIKQILINTTASIAIILISTLPLSLNPPLWFFSYFKTNALGEMQHITNFAFNFWWMIFRPTVTSIGNENLFAFSEIRLSGSPLDQSPFLGIPLSIWGISLFIVASLPLYYRIIKTKNLSPQLLFSSFALSTLLAYLFLPRMHERYMYPFFPLFAVYIGLTGRYVWQYLSLALLNLINLYISWHPMRLWLFPYELIYNVWLQWLVSICTFIVTSILYYLSFKKPSKT